MRRSQSSAAGITTMRQSQSFGLVCNRSNRAPVGSGDICYEAATTATGEPSLPFGWNPRDSSSASLNKPHAHATAAGRSLLNRPIPEPNSRRDAIGVHLSIDVTSTPSAAHMPIRRESTELTLKSSLSSSGSSFNRRKSSMNGFGNGRPMSNLLPSKSINARAAAIRTGRSLLNLPIYETNTRPFEAATDDPSLPFGWNPRDSSSASLNTPNAHAASAGRLLLDRPKPKSNLLSKSNNARAAASAAILTAIVDRPIYEPNTRRNSICGLPPNPISPDVTFTASAADRPIRRVGTDLTLKSCLSSSGLIFNRTKSSVNGFGNSTVSQGNRKNEEFNLVRKVSFSHLRVREYEVTLGDNPSVSSGAPLSLGWRYNPQENISTLDCHNEASESPSSSYPRVRRSMSALKLSDQERHHRLRDGSNVSTEDIFAVLQSTEAARLERKESLNELKMEVLKRRQDMLIQERKMMRRRRMGIVDGGLTISRSMLSL